MDNKYQDLLIQLQTASTDEEKSWLMMQFSLMNLSPTLQSAVWAAAIPHWFNFEYLNALLETPLQECDYFELLNLTFVEPFDLAVSEKNLSNCFNVHESTRSLLLEKLWEQDQAKYRELSRRAGIYCSEQNQEDTAWRVETLYHALLADLPDAEDNFINQGLNWCDTFQYDKLENLTRITLEIVTNRHINKKITYWTHYFEGLLDIYYDRYDLAEKHFMLALKYDNISEQLQAKCFFNLGNISLYLRKFNDANQYYITSLTLFQKVKDKLGQANCTYRLGNMNLRLGKHSIAKQQCQIALNLYQEIQNKFGQAYCLKNLGDIELASENNIKAKQFYEIALNLFQDIKYKQGQAFCFWQLGLTYLALMKLEQSICFINKAIQDFSSIRAKRRELFCLTISYAIQSEVAVMLDKLDVLISDEINLSLFTHELRQIIKLCEKYPDKPAFVELRKRIEIALNETKETPL